MKKVAKDESDREGFDATLDALAREGARRMILAALEVEVDAYIERLRGERLPDGRAVVVRNGRAKARKITIGSGTVTIEAPRVNDKRKIDGERQKFTSAILPPYLRRSKNVSEVLPLLYLRGLSTGDFREVLPTLLGEDAAGLSPSAITRLVSVWSEEQAAWKKRSLADRDYVYVWVDGVHFNVRLEDDRVAVLVVMGARLDGTKEVIAIEDGFRESKESWLSVLRDLRDRGMQAPVVAVGDGALGFWGALGEVFPSTIEQRCWVHKIASVLDKLPKAMQAKAKSLLHEIMNAPTRKAAKKGIKEFVANFGAKYPKATECLTKDEDTLLAFFDFPAEHWKHLRTTHPIESTFATVRLRTRVTKGPGSRAAGLAMVYKLLLAAEKTAALGLPALWERFKEATGETTKSPNKKFLVRRVEEALAVRAVEPAPAEEPQRPTRTSECATSVPEPETTLAESTPPKPRGRFASMTIEELQTKYLEVVGRSTGSDDKRYLIWKIREAEKGRINVGPRKTRARDGEPLEVKILPLRLEEDVADKMDEAWRAKGIKNRMEFFRGAIGHYLAHLGARDVAALFASPGPTGV